MAEISIPEEEFAEPPLNYWRPVPVPKPPPVVMSPFMPNCIVNGSENYGWSPSFNQPAIIHPPSVYHQASYPLTDVIHSYIQNQQIGLSPGGRSLEGERRRMSIINAEHLLYTLSTNPNYEQDNQTMTDSMIHDEVTRAAKTLFSKRNRTLLHWLNPDVNKNQIKMDVSAAWDSLPASEKVFYISQVLGKFSPHSTSLMVNPQLEPSNVEGSSVSTNTERTTGNEFNKSSNNKVRSRPKKSQTKNKLDVNVKNIKKEIETKEEESNSGIIENVSTVEPQEKQRVKRKYTKRKRKEANLEQTLVDSSSNSCSFPVEVKDIKVEPDTALPVDIKDIKVEPNTVLPVDVKDIKVEPDIELPIDVKTIKSESSNIDKNLNNPLPRPKRKYVKRKLVRKKYKKREPKQKAPINTPVTTEEKRSEEKFEPLQNDDEEMEMDLWIEFGNDSILTNEEVDSFFDSIEDPDSLFRELGIIEN